MKFKATYHSPAMQNLYEKVSLELTNALEKYMNNEIGLEELKLIQEKEKMVLNYKNWPNIKKELKFSVFELTKELYNQVNEVERLQRSFEKLQKEEIVEIDKESIVAHAYLLSRNRMPPFGFEASNWYLNPFPTIENVEALNEDMQKTN